MPFFQACPDHRLSLSRSESFTVPVSTGLSWKMWSSRVQQMYFLDHKESKHIDRGKTGKHPSYRNPGLFLKSVWMVNQL